MRSVTEGRFSSGLPYLRLGEGPPLLVSPGLSSQHANPTGLSRRMAVSWAGPFADHFTVYLTQRRPGLASGATMTDIAADYAAAIENDIAEPVLLHGTSTGGSVALQLAVDRPELVRRLVLAAAACRLGSVGRDLQSRVASFVSAGNERAAWATLLEALAPRPLRYPARGVGWVAGGAFAVDDPSDMLVTIAAEDSFDAEPALGRVQAPTLVLGGSADRFYSTDLFWRTADGIPSGRAIILAGKSHLYLAGSKAAAGMALGFLLGE